MENAGKPAGVGSGQNGPSKRTGLEQLVDKLFTSQKSYDIYFVEKGMATPQAVNEACHPSPRWLDVVLLVAVATTISLAIGGIRLTVQGEFSTPTLLLYAHVAAVYIYLAFQLFRWAYRRSSRSAEGVSDR